MCDHTLTVFHYFSYVIQKKKINHVTDQITICFFQITISNQKGRLVTRKDVSGRFADSNILRDICEKGKKISKKKKHFLISFESMNISQLATNYTIVLNTSPARVVSLTHNPNSANQASDHGGFSARSAPDCLYIYGSFFQISPCYLTRFNFTSSIQIAIFRAS